MATITTPPTPTKVRTDANALLKGNITLLSNSAISFSQSSQNISATLALKNAFMVVSYGGGNGGDQNWQIGNFDPVPFSTLDNYALTDFGSNWNGVNNWYTIPTSGYYKITTKLRVTDGEPTGDSYGQGAENAASLGDSANFLWFACNPNRNGSLNIRSDHWTAGTHIQMLAYADNNNWTSDGSMQIQLLYPD